MAEMTYPHLSKAPIIEAVIDIQTIHTGQMTQPQVLEKLRAAHEDLKTDFPDMQTMMSKQIQVTGNPPETSVQDFVHGYFFKSVDGASVIQFRPTGYALSCVKKYDSFDVLVAAARRNWPTYEKATAPIAIRRIATRFINQIKIPFPLADTNEYLSEIRKPKTSPSDTKLIKAFADQSMSLDVKSGATVNLVRFMQEPQKDAAEAIVTVDLDVYRLVSDVSIDDKQLWDIVASFREVKNRIFFETVGKRVIDACL